MRFSPGPLTIMVTGANIVIKLGGKQTVFSAANLKENEAGQASHFPSLGVQYIMEIRLLDFFLGLGIGLGLGLGLAWLGGRVRTWLGKSALGRLTAENRELKRRLAEKDRHVSRMLKETERLAEKLAQGKALETGQGGG
jgi:hypothetical protein